MKKNLIVTLANEPFLDQAKQVFSSIYWNAGWKGDYMLLAHDVPERKLAWFREKGILVRKCKPIFKNAGMPLEVLLSKYYLFKPEFKKWNAVVFLDADTMVNASLDGLTKVRGFAAPESEMFLEKIKGPFLMRLMNIDKGIFEELKKEYNLNKRPFCSGVMAFNTEIIKKDTFKKLIGLYKKYGMLSECYDEMALNLLFYRNFKKVPDAYNIYPFFFTSRGIEKENMFGAILHFVIEKPWIPGAIFYKEWKQSLDRADLINLKNRPKAAKVLSKEEIEKCGKLYNSMLHKPRNLKKIFADSKMTIDRHMGLFGIYLKYRHNWLYRLLKRLK